MVGEMTASSSREIAGEWPGSSRRGFMVTKINRNGWKMTASSSREISLQFLASSQIKTAKKFPRIFQIEMVRYFPDFFSVFLDIH
jgi:hypothetical protein